MYTCRVYDTRSSSTQLNDTQIMVTEISIPVYVAEAKDVCQEAYEGGVIWPQTKKVCSAGCQSKFWIGYEAQKSLQAKQKIIVLSFR